jgi:sugar O-acyltransferase (sialic acid O-acetyltransferase NeuD family)
MTQPIYAVYGASGFGREVMYIAREQLLRDGGSIDQLVFIDDNPQSGIVNGHKVLTYDDFMSLESTDRHVTIAIADSSIRQKLTERISADNTQLWQISASNAVVMDQVEMGPGAILCPFVTITSNIKIGKCFQANIYSYVAHDCHIGDFVTFAPDVKCNGNVTIEDHAYIATGATIRQGKPGRPLIIGEGAIVGMGAVVTKNVPPGVTVIGNPAAPLSKENLRRK